MSTAFERLRPELEALSASERAEIAQFPLASLGPDEDADAESAWDRELERREAEIRGGEVQGKPAEQVFAELRDHFS